MASTSAPCASGAHTGSWNAPRPEMATVRDVYSLPARTRLANRQTACRRCSGAAAVKQAPRVQSASQRGLIEVPVVSTSLLLAGVSRDAPPRADPTVHMQLVVCGRRGWRKLAAGLGTKQPHDRRQPASQPAGGRGAAAAIAHFRNHAARAVSPPSNARVDAAAVGAEQPSRGGSESGAREAALGPKQPQRRGLDARARAKASLDPRTAAHLLFATCATDCVAGHEAP
jgi:hypothetical protein